MANRVEIGPVVGILDLETMDKFDSAIILSGGIVVADITKRIPFEQLISPKHSWFFKFDSVDQRNRGRTISADTVHKFWMNKDRVSEEARIASFYPDESRDINVSDFPSLLNKELGRLNGHDIHWFDRNCFDFWKIAHLFDVTLGLGEASTPFTPTNTWEISTVLQHLGQDRYGGIGPWDYKTRGFVYHDPVHDSALDWLRYQRALETVGLIEVTEV